MKKNQRIVKQLCFPSCSYYKPGKNEELLCRGAVVIDRLLHAGRPILPLGTGTEPDLETIEKIIEKMCSACDFHERDCDFMENRMSRPCGGFIVLSRLIMSGQVQIDEIT